MELYEVIQKLSLLSRGRIKDNRKSTNEQRHKSIISDNAILPNVVWLAFGVNLNKWWNIIIKSYSVPRRQCVLIAPLSVPCQQRLVGLAGKASVPMTHIDSSRHRGSMSKNENFSGNDFKEIASFNSCFYRLDNIVKWFLHLWNRLDTFFLLVY